MKRNADGSYPRGLVRTHEEDEPDLYVTPAEEERIAVEEECAAMRTHEAMWARRKKADQ